MAHAPNSRELPSELMSEIFANCKLTPGWEPDWYKRHAFLLELSRVCKSWAGPAQAMLFREVRFPENEEDGPEQGILPILNTFLDTMRRHRDRGTGLPLAVRSLALTLGLAPSYDYSAKQDVDAVGCPLVKLVNDIVADDLLGALYHLELSNQGGWIDFDKYKADPAKTHLAALTFDKPQLDKLRGAKRQIHALTLKIIEYDMPMFAQLITGFPALQYLDITGTEQVSFTDLGDTYGVEDVQNLAGLRELRVATGATAADFAARLGDYNHVEILHVKELANLAQLDGYRSRVTRLFINEWRQSGDTGSADEATLTRFPLLTNIFIAGQSNQRGQVQTIVKNSLRVNHIGAWFEATRLVSCKEMVKLFQELLPPNDAARPLITVGVYASAMPFYLHPDVPPAEELTQFKTERETEIEWFDELELIAIPEINLG
ncbi:hypothetical protein BKA62DRAFT_709512 [Auriculariales sp. MPI-PUGE-AT-0066]|nr:hypothetical protein BKA62DRAFT_709512 [Auriculariales sp. MPI-PUGE-AT-0066]